MGTSAVGVATDGAAMAGAPPATSTAAAQLTAADVANWTPEQLVTHAETYLAFKADDVKALKASDLDGQSLLNGTAVPSLTPGAAGRLSTFVQLLRTGGPKTVRILQQADVTNRKRFSSQQDLDNVLARVGASGLRDEAGNDISELRDLKDDGLYEYAFQTGSILATVKAHKATLETNDKIVLDQMVATVAQNSLLLFGVQLDRANTKHNVKVRQNTKTAGDVDTLMKGDGLHVLIERKRRIASKQDADGVVQQAQDTLSGYTLLKKHITDDIECRLRLMVFAEAIQPDAIDVLRRAGLYVITGADMQVLTPESQ